MRAVLASEFGGPGQLRLGHAADPAADGRALMVLSRPGLPAQAHRILKRRHATGKIILQVTH